MKRDTNKKIKKVSANKQGKKKKNSGNIIEFIPGINDWLICSAYPANKKVNKKTPINK